MEQSMFEALSIGVSVFIFVIALTAGILLMSNIIDMVNFANEQAVVGMNGTLAQTVGVVDERVYTGRQLLTYYKEEVQALEQQKRESEYSFYVRVDGVTDNKLQDYIKNTRIDNYLNKEFLLTYKGLSSNKHVYVFVSK